MFYLKIACQNIKNSLRVFAPFVLASLVLYSLLGSLFLLMLTPVMESMGTGSITLGLGVMVLTIFSLIMEIYSFNFLMQQRTKEFGLYNMLGMNKKKVSLIASIELFLIFLVVTFLGSALAAVFSNLLYLIFVNLTHYNELHFTIMPLAFIFTSMIFAAIFFVLELIAIWTIGKTSPLILFRASEKGEREPKGNILLAALGVLALSVGYYLSLSSRELGSGLIFRFFVAVLFVIAGTYLFYISFMTWYLKKRRKNKAYFYQPEHFITTSQMIFRMKQHATGLANITLLAVMAFVTIATTTSLYTGMVSSIRNLYPKETSVTIFAADREKAQATLANAISSKFPEKAAEAMTYLTFDAGIGYDEGKEMRVTAEPASQADYATMTFTHIITQDDFRALGHDLPQLADNQLAFIRPNGKTALETVVFGDKVFEQVAFTGSLQFPDIVNTLNPSVMVVSNDQVLMDIKALFDQKGDMGIGQNLTYRAFLDLTDEEVASIGSANGDSIEFVDLADESGETFGTIMQRHNFEQSLYGFTGGFLFTGFLLGTSFLLGASLIIYYKQYSEGHEDKKSYKILQEVGMSEQAVRKTINSQVILVFFMPLAMATLHFIISLVMLKQMLLLFGVSSSSLIYTVSGLTILLICLVYYLIYKWTSKTYYRIIERRNS